MKSTGQAAVEHLIGMIAEELTSFAKVALNLAVAFEKPAALIEFGPVVTGCGAAADRLSCLLLRRCH